MSTTLLRETEWRTLSWESIHQPFGGLWCYVPPITNFEWLKEVAVNAETSRMVLREALNHDYTDEYIEVVGGLFDALNSMDTLLATGEHSINTLYNISIETTGEIDYSRRIAHKFGCKATSKFLN